MRRKTWMPRPCPRRSGFRRAGGRNPGMPEGGAARPNCRRWLWVAGFRRDDDGLGFAPRCLLRQLHEVRKLQFRLGDRFRPDRDLLLVLPLEYEAGDEA